MAVADSSSDRPGGYPHSVKFYSDETALGRTVAEFLAPGLREHLPAIVIATPDHIALISAELDRRGLDVSQLEADGDLQVLDADEVLTRFMVGPQPDPVRFHQTVDAISSVPAKIDSRAPSARTARWSTCCGSAPMLRARSRWRCSGIAWRPRRSFHCCAAMPSATSIKRWWTVPTMQTVCEQHTHIIPDERAS